MSKAGENCCKKKERSPETKRRDAGHEHHVSLEMGWVAQGRGERGKRGKEESLGEIQRGSRGGRGSLEEIVQGRRWQACPAFPTTVSAKGNARRERQLRGGSTGRRQAGGQAGLDTTRRRAAVGGL